LAIRGGGGVKKRKRGEEESPGGEQNGQEHCFDASSAANGRLLRENLRGKSVRCSAYVRRFCRESGERPMPQCARHANSAAASVCAQSGAPNTHVCPQQTGRTSRGGGPSPVHRRQSAPPGSHAVSSQSETLCAAVIRHD